MRILIVEDDRILAQNLADAIASQGYVVDTVFDGQEAQQQVQLVDYDLIILDLMLPKLDGLSLCQQLRSQHFTKPILMLTALDTKNDEIKGLDAGADDYLVKPFDLLVLLARIRALLRRETDSCPILTWEGLSLNPITYKVTYEDRSLHLTPKEYSILEVLMRHGQAVLSRSVILGKIWSFDDPPSEYTIKTHINALRQKLQAVGAPKDLILTIRGMGYCLSNRQSLNKN